MSPLFLIFIQIFTSNLHFQTFPHRIFLLFITALNSTFQPLENSCLCFQPQIVFSSTLSFIILKHCPFLKINAKGKKNDEKVPEDVWKLYTSGSFSAHRVKPNGKTIKCSWSVPKVFSWICFPSLLKKLIFVLIPVFFF